MSSYNSINGTTATENELLETPLTTEWGFDGVVVTDWTAVRSLERRAGPPGPGDARPGRRAGATRSSPPSRPAGLPRAAILEKVPRILRLAARVGALEGFDPAVPGTARAD